jgi:hypothetical protein
LACLMSTCRTADDAVRAPNGTFIWTNTCRVVGVCDGRPCLRYRARTLPTGGATATRN